jgi:hypothetical protein
MVTRLFVWSGPSLRQHVLSTTVTSPRWRSCTRLEETQNVRRRCPLTVGMQRRVVPPAGQVGDQRFEGFAIGEFSGPRQREHILIAQRLDQAHVGPEGIGGVRDDDDLLAPGRRPDITQHLPEQGVFGLIGGIVLASEQRNIDREAIDAPVDREEYDAKPEDIGLQVPEPGFLRHRIFGASLALDGAVADEREEPICGGRQCLQDLVGKPPQQCLRAPRGRAEQPAVMLVGQMARALTAQFLQVGLVAIQEMLHQEPTAHAVMRVANARSQHAQALRHVTRETGQGHGLGLLCDTRSNGHSRSSILGAPGLARVFTPNYDQTYHI